MSSRARNLVVITTGLNDVLKGEKGKLGQEIAKGVNNLRATAPNVLIAVNTMPEKTKQGMHTERAVLSTNSEILMRGAPPGGLQPTDVFCMGSTVLLRGAAISFLGPKRISRSSTARLRVPEDANSLLRESDFIQRKAALNHGKLGLVLAGLGLTTGTVNAGYDRRRRGPPRRAPERRPK